MHKILIEVENIEKRKTEQDEHLAKFGMLLKYSFNAKISANHRNSVWRSAFLLAHLSNVVIFIFFSGFETPANCWNKRKGPSSLNILPFTTLLPKALAHSLKPVRCDASVIYAELPGHRT